MNIYPLLAYEAKNSRDFVINSIKHFFALRRRVLAFLFTKSLSLKFVLQPVVGSPFFPPSPSQWPQKLRMKNT